MDYSHSSKRHCSEVNKVAKSEHRDRLSKLPDSLILLILSLLEMRDVVRTTILSKFWRNRWTKVPCLDFMYHKYDLLGYRDSINRALEQWEGPKIQKFSITFPNSYPRDNDFDPWLLFAIEKQAEELRLDITALREADSDYSPPQRLYSCSSLTKLSLSYFKLVIEETVQWDRLKSLRLVNVNSLTADAMNRILRGAPCLEELLILRIWRITENFSIRSTSLKALYVSEETYCPEIAEVCAGSELRIWAPNLLTLEIHARFEGSCVLYVPSLTKAVLYFDECYTDRVSGRFSRIEMFNNVFQSVRHVENITLSPWCCKFLLYMKKMKKDMAVQFSNAKFLNMFRNSYRLPSDQHDETFDIEMFPELMNVTVKYLYAQKGYIIMCKMSPSLCHLRTIEIFVSANEESIFDWIKVVLKNAGALEKLLLRLTVLDEPRSLVYNGTLREIRKLFDLAEEKVRSMPRSSASTAEVTVIRQL